MPGQGELVGDPKAIICEDLPAKLTAYMDKHGKLPKDVEARERGALGALMHAGYLRKMSGRHADRT